MSSHSQHVSVLIAVAALVVVVGAVAFIGYKFMPVEEEIIQGQVDVSEYRISSKVPGRILELRVGEGDYVHAGDTVAILEAPEVAANEESAQAAVNAAEALSDMANNGARKEQVQGALEMWNKAKAGLEIAQKSYERVNRLYEEGVMTAQKRDEVYANYQAMLAQEQAAKSQYDMAVNGARAEEKRAAAEKVNMAKGQVSLVNAYKKETVQCATQDGQVSEVFPKVGELVGTGSPIMSILLTDDIWGAFNIREDQFDGLKVGDEITATVPAFNNKEIKMKVFFIKDQGSYAVWKAAKANGQWDLKTFEVKARPTKKVEGLLPGMSLILKN